MHKLLLIPIALFLASCKNLTPEQNAALFNAGLATGQKIVDQKVLNQK